MLPVFRASRQQVEDSRIAGPLLPRLDAFSPVSIAGKVGGRHFLPRRTMYAHTHTYPFREACIGILHSVPGVCRLEEIANMSRKAELSMTEETHHKLTLAFIGLNSLTSTSLTRITKAGYLGKHCGGMLSLTLPENSAHAIAAAAAAAAASGPASSFVASDISVRN